MSTSRILIITPAWIGDAIMAHALIRDLNSYHPKSLIDVLAPVATADLFTCMPEINQIIPLPLGHGGLNLTTRYAMGSKLHANGYDQAIVLPNTFKSALIPWFAKIPLRTGWRGECRYGLLTDLRYLDKAHYPRMVDQYRALGLAANTVLPAMKLVPQLTVTSHLTEHVRQKFAPLLINQPILALGVGAAYGDAKRWPLQYFIQVAKQKLSENWAIWLFGANTDLPTIEQLMHATQYGCRSFAGKTELHETIALLNLTTGVLANDSGLMHMAAALNKHLIAVYGPTSPSFTPPLSSRATILKLDLACQPCFKRSCPLKHHACMQNLTPDKILAAISTWPIGAPCVF